MTPLQQMIAKVRNAHAMAAPDTVEHVVLHTSSDGRAWMHKFASGEVPPRYAFRDITPPDADDSLHPWERDLVTNGEPFARPSNRVRS